MFVVSSHRLELTTGLKAGNGLKHSSLHAWTKDTMWAAASCSNHHTTPHGDRLSSQTLVQNKIDPPSVIFVRYFVTAVRKATDMVLIASGGQILLYSQRHRNSKGLRMQRWWWIIQASSKATPRMAERDLLQREREGKGGREPWGFYTAGFGEARSGRKPNAWGTWSWKVTTCCRGLIAQLIQWLLSGDSDFSPLEP